MERTKVLFISLGCDKNLVDSEMMIGMLQDAGYEITNEEEEAEVIVVNTCCFIMDAKEESINTLIEMGKLKETAKCKVLMATGCLAQRYATEIHEQIPEVDVILGTASFDHIVEAMTKALEGTYQDVMKEISGVPISGKRRALSTGGHYAYLKIAEGCDKRCSYCIIPKVRGNYRSVPMETLLNEAAELANQGVKELILVAQETTVYGTDLYGEKKLPELLEKLCRIDELKWIRILYCYPEEITDELIAVMKKEEKICHYLDMPIQHADDYILQRMGRKTNQAFLRDMVAKLRREIPDICLRTTLITGFPGEDDEMFGQMRDFVEEMRFERLGSFTYSPEEDTVAAEMPDQIPEEVKAERRDEIMQLQQEIAFENAEEMIGKEMMVMIEGRLVEENVLIGRSYMDAPGVDGYVFVDSMLDLPSGAMVKVQITDCNEYDLIGGIVDESAE